MKLALSTAALTLSILSLLSASQQALQKLLNQSLDFSFGDLRELIANPEPGLDLLGEVLLLPWDSKGFVHELMPSTAVQLHHLEIAASAHNGKYTRLLKSHLCTTFMEHTIIPSEEYKRPFDMVRLEQITCNSPSLTLSEVFDLMVLWNSDDAQYQAGKAFLERHGLKLTHSNLFTPVQFGRIANIQRYLPEIDLKTFINLGLNASEILIDCYAKMSINEHVPSCDKAAVGDFLFNQLRIKANGDALSGFFATIKGQETKPDVISAIVLIMKNGVVTGISNDPKPLTAKKNKPIPENW